MNRSVALRAALSSAFVLACASSPHYTKAPGSSPDRALYRIGALAFEAPSGFREGSLPFFDFLLSPPSAAAQGGSRGLTLSYCKSRDPESCGVLGVRRGSDLGPACTDPEQFRLWYKKADAIVPVKYAGRDGWLITATDAIDYSRTLVLCDGEEYWFARSIAMGPDGTSPARFAFDLLVKTVRADPAAPRAASGT